MQVQKRTGLTVAVVAMMSVIGVAAADGNLASESPAVLAHTAENAGISADRAFAFGLTYDNGTAVPRDYARALYWYTRAAEAGHAEAMNRLGIFNAMGYGVPQDYDKAAQWYIRGAENGSASAMNNIATAYFNGLGVPRDYSVAARWLTPLANAGDPRAQNKLALLYRYGLGVTKSGEVAFDLLTLAAAQEYAPAMANLGVMYADPDSPMHDEKRGAQLIEAALESGLPEGMREVMATKLKSAPMMSF